MTEESAVKVCVRVRPLISREKSGAPENAEPVQLFWKADKKSIHQNDDGNSTKSFSFDRVFTAEETTNQLYQDIAKPLVVSSVEGYNGTIFAYGQTSSGKTFTMMGSEHIPGVIPLAVEDVFQTIKNCPKKEFLLRVSYMEIYNETVTDLLVDSWKRKPLEVREAMNKNIYVADLTEELVTSPSQALAWIQKGEKNRHYGKTKMNQRSSRSHTIFRMILESRERSDPSGENADGAIIVSHLNLVDLAGSERASQTGAEGTRFKEGCNINRSLFILGQVIKKLTDENQKGFTNYRDSKLTRILQNSLGGNAKTVIICTITPVVVEETLSTLQFASTAKKMKNDPHVTEVSDDGALLKRYRNEIVDLKRRLHEVSSVTQTTATEKNVLSQLLQEKDQLQREQEDRIRNLTKLLVTSSNLVPVKKMPKRRVTWGGKMLRLARPSTCGSASSDISFAGSFTRKGKADHSSCLSEVGEEEVFDSQWEIPDEPLYDLETSQCSVTDRSFGDSPKDLVSSDWMHELSGKVSNLELQLDVESQQKEEVMAKVEKLDGIVSELEQQLDIKSQEKEDASAKVDILHNRVSELELEVQTGVQQKQEAVEKILEMGQRVAELELQLHVETQQKLGAMEKIGMLEIRMADLEMELADQSDVNGETNEQMRREYAETIQLCETLASEKDVVVAERDYLKQELGMFIEQIENLEKEKSALSCEVVEKRELDEFNRLEDEIRKEHEDELKSEILRLKKVLDSSELQCQGLQNKLDALSEELKRKTEFAEQLQNLSGKDLVREVAMLRLSLDDAEGISRDTKKEWAVLRTQNMALEETNLTLSANHEKMEAEVKSLQFQLESERSRYRKMQSDLQKELNVAFEENTKLTTLLDGKVPKNLIDSVELESTVANLNKELAAAQEAERALRAQLEELASTQILPEKVDNLMKQLEESEQCRASLEYKLKDMQQLVKELEEKRNQLSQELQCAHTENTLLCEQNAGSQTSAEEMKQLLSTVTVERDQLRVSLQHNVEMVAETQALLQSLQDELEEQKQNNLDLEKLHEQKELDFAEQMLRQTQDLQCVQDEKDTHLMTSAQSSAGEVEKLLSAVASLGAERDQLKVDMQENVDMMIENQEELRTALEKNRALKERIKELEAAQASKQHYSPSKVSAQLQELQTHVKTLTEELESVRAERERLLSQGTTSTWSSTEEMEKLLCRVTRLTEERDQLHQILEGLRQEKIQLKAELEDMMVVAVQAQSGFSQPDIQTSEFQAFDERTKLQQEIEQLQATLQIVSEQKFQMEGDLQRIMDTAAETENQLQSLQKQNQRNSELERINQETQAQLEQVAEAQCLIHSLQQELQEQKQKHLDLGKLCEQKESDSEQQVKTLMEELESTRAERDALFEKENDRRGSTEEMLNLQCRVTSLSEERDQLQETLERLRREKNQLKEELEDRMEMVQCELQQQQLSSEAHSLKEQQEAQQLLQIQQLQEHLEKSREEVNQLKSDLQENVLLITQLNVSLETVTEQKKQLVDGLQENVIKSSTTQELLNSVQEELCKQKQINSRLLQQSQENDQQIQTLSEHLESVKREKDALLSDGRTSSLTTTENMEMHCRVASLSKENNQLQDTVEGLRKEKDQLQDTVEGLRKGKDQMQDTVEGLRKETDQLQDTVEGLRKETDQLQDTVEGLRKETDQLQDTVEGLRKGKEQLKAKLETMSLVKDKLKGTLEAVRLEKDQIIAELKDRMEALQTQMKALTEKLQSVEGERCILLSDMEKMHCTVASISEERDQLHEKLEALKQETTQLNAEIFTIKQKLSEQEQLNMQQQIERTLEAKLRQELLSGRNETISSLTEQLSSLDQTPAEVKDTVSSRLQESAGQLEWHFGQFQGYGDGFSKIIPQLMNTIMELSSRNMEPHEPTASSTTAYNDVSLQSVQTLTHILDHLRLRAHGYRNLFEVLEKTDLAVFKERRLQDLLLCWTQAPKDSVKDEDFQTIWEDRLTNLLGKRQLYVQKLENIFGRIGTSSFCVDKWLSAENSRLPINGSLGHELDQRSAVAQYIKTLQDIIEEHNGLFEELKLLQAQAESDLREVRSKTSTLLKALDWAPVKNEISLVKDTNQLSLQLQQTEEHVKVLLSQNKQLEEAEVKANTSVSNHKKATQLLQTELQDTRAQVEEKEAAIQSLKSKLRESERNESPTAVELEKLRAKLLKVEVELSSASDNHQQEIQKMTTVLNEKEDSLRKVKEALRRAQQQGEQSFLQGEELHARLTNTRGLVVKSSIVLEKTKLEEEIKRLGLKITELESLVSSQQAEINKWKTRAIKLKVKTNTEVDAPSSPYTSTKRGLPMSPDRTNLFSSPKRFMVTPKKILDSPRKLLDSPKVPLLDSPKSRFFDVGATSELLSTNRPKQFFDNSLLGTIPDVAAGADKEEWWPRSPTQEEMCKTQ